MPDTSRLAESSSRVSKMSVDIVKARLPRLQQVVEFEVGSGSPCGLSA